MDLFHLLFPNLPTHLFFSSLRQAWDFRLHFPWVWWRWGNGSHLPTADPPRHCCRIPLGQVGFSPFEMMPGFQQVCAVCSWGKQPLPKPWLGSLCRRQRWEFPASQQCSRTISSISEWQGWIRAEMKVLAPMHHLQHCQVPAGCGEGRKTAGERCGEGKPFTKAASCL